MIDSWLSQISQVITQNVWLAPLLALIAGVLTSLTPCSLSSVPLIIGYVGGTGARNTKKAFAYSIIFSAGTAITFVILGIIATSAGKLMGRSSTVWYMVLGILMVLLAIVAGKGNLILGILLMLLYSLGHSTLVIVAGTSFGFVQKINENKRYQTTAKVLKIVMGTAILLIGFYMFWLAF